MPTYDYQCGKCGFEFEREQRITADPIKTCPECKSRKAKRLLSASRFILKGSGWYADGYGSSAPKSSDSGGGSETGSGAGSGGGSETGSGAGSGGDSDSKGTSKKESSNTPSSDSGSSDSSGGAKTKKSAA
jgi:putative FmdB family regulatory protein